MFRPMKPSMAPPSFLAADFIAYTPEDVERILEQYGVDRIFVGHTIFDDVTPFFDGKVVAVNVNNQKNREAGKGRGILMQGNTLYVIYDKGKPRKF